MFFESSLFVGLIIGYFMYVDAKNRKLENPTTWFFVGWLFGLFGLATYWYWHIRPRAHSVDSFTKAATTDDNSTIVQPLVSSDNTVDIAQLNTPLVPPKLSKKKLKFLTPIGVAIAVITIVSPRLFNNTETKEFYLALIGSVLVFICLALGRSENNRDPNNPKNIKTSVLVFALVNAILVICLYFVVSFAKWWNF